MITDLNTGTATDTRNLYTGRRIRVHFEFGSTGATAASDAWFDNNDINVSIFNMTYASGLTTEYQIDVYGIRANVATDPKNIVAPKDVTITTVTAGETFDTDVEFDLSEAYTAVSGTNAGSTIGVAGGNAFMYAKIGNEYGGYQYIRITLDYLDRRIDSLFTLDEANHKDGVYIPYAYDTDFEGEETAVHFEIDPFAAYSVSSVYPQQGSNVTFREDAGSSGNRDTASFSVTGEQTDLTVTWDDTRVIRNYSGSNNSYVTATVSYNGKYSQTVEYYVIVYDRTVTGFDSLLKDGVYDANNNIIPIKPYDYMYADDLSTAIAEKYLKGGGNDDNLFYVKFGNIPRNSEAYTLSFTLGGTASQFSVQPEYPFGEELLQSALTSAEKTMKISFVLDSARGISYQGRDARFYVTIPGFALGEKGQQLARQDLPVEEQYIIGIRFSANDSMDADVAAYTLGYSEWLGQMNQNFALSRIETNDASYYYDTYLVGSPYDYITKGGLLLPQTAVIYVGSVSDLTDADGNPLTEGTTAYAKALNDINGANVNGSYQIELTWNNVVNSQDGTRSRISYNKYDHSTSFQMDLDGQSYQLRFRIAEGWVLDNDIIISSGVSYNKDEVILLPQEASNPKVTISPSNTNPSLYNTYTVTFGDGKIFSFKGVAGGGSYSDNYMKWSFDEVNWENSIAIQYATLTLGGKGGQTVRWAFTVNTNKKLVNNTIPTMYALAEGESVTLPSTYKQLFSGVSLSNSKEIPVYYSTSITGFYTGDDYPLGLIKSGYRVEATHFTPSYKYTMSEQDEGSLPKPYYTGYVLWDATKDRAYPSPSKSVGGQIVFCVYRAPTTQDVAASGQSNIYNTLTTSGIMLYNPDAVYGYSELRPVMSDAYTYPDSLPTTTKESVSFIRTDTMMMYKLPSTGYYIRYSNGKFVQNSVPNILVESGAVFDLRNLPMMSMNLYRPTVSVTTGGIAGGTTTYQGIDFDLLYLIPWQKSKVYYLADRYSAVPGTLGDTVTGGFGAIDTGSKPNGRYTLVTEISVGGYDIEVKCAIDIV